MSKTIVAIGGGDVRLNETLPIDKEIIRLTGKKHPKLLFIPTASSDSESYWEVIYNHFGKKLGCKTDVLFLIKEKHTKAELTRKILSQDIIYVGGGNTLKMMRLWRRLGIDKLLTQAWKQGTILAGVSAGSICWFEGGHSDSMSFYNPKKWKYIRVTGLGLIKGTHCPHYDSHTLEIPRREHFHNMVKKIGGKGIAIDNNCALVITDGQHRVLSAVKGAGVYHVQRNKGKVVSRKL